MEFCMKNAHGKPNPFIIIRFTLQHCKYKSCWLPLYSQFSFAVTQITWAYIDIYGSYVCEYQMEILPICLVFKINSNGSWIPLKWTHAQGYCLCRRRNGLGVFDTFQFTSEMPAFAICVGTHRLLSYYMQFQSSNNKL
jgi:hypothetical protein